MSHMPASFSLVCTSGLTFPFVNGARVQGMAVEDPKALWVMQGWAFSYDSFWTKARIQAYLRYIERLGRRSSSSLQSRDCGIML